MSFKSFDQSQDVASLVSSINEVVSISSSIYAQDLNVKKFSNIASASVGANLGGYWQSVYDSSPTSSLSTPLFDISFGFTTGSIFNLPATVSSSQNEKIKIYRHFASTLLGDPDSLFSVNSQPRSECFFLSIKRNIQKDEIKKGSTSLIINRQTEQVTASDEGAVTNFKQTVGGDYAPLKTGSADTEAAQIWYQAGVIVVPVDLAWPAFTAWSGAKAVDELESSGSINELVDGFRTHIEKVTLHNQTNLFSTVYFCRAMNTEFNYSSNPTFVDDEKRIRVTSGSNILQTRSYVTTIGLYDANDNLLAVAKVNKPITKSPDTEATFRVRLDY